jgi:hypothetical protein
LDEVKRDVLGSVWACGELLLMAGAGLLQVSMKGRTPFIPKV